MIRRLFALALVIFAPAFGAHADEPLSDSAILGAPPGFTIESLRLRFTHYDQEGRGYQSQADRPQVSQPGSEAVTVEQPQLEVVANQGKFTHRLWVPVDIVTAASPDALDAISSASRTNEAASLDLTSTYHLSHESDLFLRGGFHLEEPFRSWNLGVGGSRSFADDNTVISASLNQVFDWLDRFNIFGTRLGRDYRSSTNANLGVTQLLSPTTVAHLEYGVTVQLGQLSNTWNAVPLATGNLAEERLPSLRHRHAFVGRLAQALPWHGAIHGFYRFYVDNWGILAHSFEVALYQRFSSFGYVRLNYRVHHQTAPYFWTPSAAANAQYRSADSDLADFTAQTLGALVAVDLRFVRRVQSMHLDFGYERYFRTNDLRVNIYTCALGFVF
ncbi:MAG TPA: DUF3570 domain-containing protein [Polyangia bacterium]